MADPDEIYDARRCRVCGCVWSEHTADCPRHAYRPMQVPGWVAEVAARRGLEHNGYKVEGKA